MLYKLYKILTSLAIQVIKAAGLAVAINVRACLALLQESAAGVRGRPYVILQFLKRAFYFQYHFFYFTFFFQFTSVPVYQPRNKALEVQEEFY